MNGPLLLAVAAAGITGYTIGRTRPGPRLINWAENQVAMRPARSPRYWIAIPLLLLAAATYTAIHPRRAAANIRAARAHTAPAPMPRLDPDWATRRAAQDARPPHHGLPCVVEGWLCRYPADDGHSRHAPYREGEYTR